MYPLLRSDSPKSSVDDLCTGRGVVRGRAATTLRSIETQPFWLGDLSCQLDKSPSKVERKGLGNQQWKKKNSKKNFPSPRSWGRLAFFGILCIFFSKFLEVDVDMLLFYFVPSPLKIIWPEGQSIRSKKNKKIFSTSSTKGGPKAVFGYFAFFILSSYKPMSKCYCFTLFQVPWRLFGQKDSRLRAISKNFVFRL